VASCAWTLQLIVASASHCCISSLHLCSMLHLFVASHLIVASHRCISYDRCISSLHLIWSLHFIVASHLIVTFACTLEHACVVSLLIHTGCVNYANKTFSLLYSHFFHADNKMQTITKLRRLWNIYPHINEILGASLYTEHYCNGISTFVKPISHWIKWTVLERVARNCATSHLCAINFVYMQLATKPYLCVITRV